MKKITMQDVAEYTGVSLTTVSRVVNGTGYVSKAKRIEVQEAIAATGYVLPQTSKINADKKGKIIGLILRKLPENFFYYKLTSALMQAADQCGYHTMVMYGEDLNNDALLEHIRKFQQYQVNGIVIGGFGEEYLREDVRIYLQECGMPLVFIERTAGCIGFNRVLVDSASGTQMATKHLIRQGHKNLLYITRGREGEVENARMDGFLRTIREIREEERPKYRIIPCPDNSVGVGYEAARTAFCDDPDITGILAWFDGDAAGAMQYLYKIGKRVPDEVEIIGYDDTYADKMAPPISSVHMPIEEMAFAAVDMIVANQNDTKEFYAKTVILEPKLILRGVTEIGI